MARALLALLLVAPLALAEGRSPLTPEQETELVRVLGGPEEWGRFRPDRQRMLQHRYARFLGLPAEKRDKVAERGLKEFLLKPSHRFDLGALPAPLRADLEAMPREVRPLAAKLAVMRLRQLRLDRNLRFVPEAKRWDVFRRLFPEPFDPEAARAASKELELHVARTVAERIRQKLALAAEQRPGFDPERHKREFVRREIRQHEERIVRHVQRSLFEARHESAADFRRHLERKGYFMLERLRSVTPRQRELIRYAFLPHECPLVDLEALGPRPEDPAARREWMRDVQILGRLELLFEAGFPREIVLHLAGTGSPEDFWRAVRALRRPRK